MRKWFETNTQRLVWWFTIHSTVWVYMSYILAFRGAEDIAESLSKVIVSEIIAVLLGYMIKAVIENVFKHNEFVGVKKKNVGRDKENVIKRDY